MACRVQRSPTIRLPPTPFRLRVPELCSPRLDVGMFHRFSGINLSERFKRLSVALILEPDVVRERFLHEPAPWAIQSLRKAIELHGQFLWHVSGYHTSGH